MDQIISSQAMRQWEEANFAARLADPLDLMHIAGSGCAQEFCQYSKRFPDFRRLVIFAGHGNNGGDGVVIADTLSKILPQKILLALALPAEKFSPSSRHFFKRLPGSVEVVPAADVVLRSGDLIIDALLGTGCRAPLREPYKSLIGQINRSRLKVFSIDLPSGLGTDISVKADMTAVIGGFKDLLFTADGVENSGALRLVELPLELAPSDPGKLFATHAQWYIRTTPPQDRNIHKYQRGSVLVIGGSREYLQAPFLTARSALRNGAGLVRLAVPFAVPPANGTLGVINQTIAAEKGCFTGKSMTHIQPFTAKTSCIAAGPGMGRECATTDFVAQLLEMPTPLILDADALYHTSQLLEKLQRRPAPTILTPHWGEAQKLAAGANSVLPEDPVQAAIMLAKLCNAAVLLKGARSVIADPTGKVYLNTSGTPALATAGSGDVLTGLIAGEVAQAGGITTLAQGALSAARGAFLHGMAGELAQLQFGSRGVLADDLTEYAARSAAYLENKLYKQ